eukprot:gnl/MRDRNA2_/MRDRNA2_105460_c0_seq1.p1 gnl/MRDRNA2_/MRDRNA2_105460_c0~~gnl/MRDRNA2_/MRDRNA2_105460_c0_seq1.p1  ORF type:complete len:113 (+),score=15.55 gnl/MRDRNA2_/MRDRNA2_105460_c0_seq1:60-398(+)
MGEMMRPDGTQEGSYTRSDKDHMKIKGVHTSHNRPVDCPNHPFVKFNLPENWQPSKFAKSMLVEEFVEKEANDGDSTYNPSKPVPGKCFEHVLIGKFPYQDPKTRKKYPVIP